MTKSIQTQTTPPVDSPSKSAEADRPTPKKVALPRLVSLDAYRGFIMLAMASSGLGLAGVAKLYPGNPLWQFLGFHSDHVEWVGCAFWDLIQPSFMFMVGVALPFSVASRQAKGDSTTWIFVHALWRSLLLILLGVFLTSNWRKPEQGQMTAWIFTNVLCQIGLGYPFLFLLHGRGWKVQVAVLLIILVGVTLAFGLYPAPGSDFNKAAVGLPANWPLFDGWFAHWNKNANLGHAFDVWFLNLWPRGANEPFVFNNGGYSTLNFIPSLATMILGLMTGEMLRRDRTVPWQLLWLVSVGLICLGLGLLMGLTVCPLVKRIWTPSWALYSSGWTLLILAGFHAVIEGLRWKWWAFPLVVVGMNSIAIYCMYQLMKPWIVHSLKVHLGTDLFAAPAGIVLQHAAALLVLWLICFWMYRRKLFLKI